MNLKENVNEGLRSIQSNMLRTVLTALIIAIGITSLVGILTAIDGIQSSVNSSFADLGANTFSIRNYENGNRRSGGRQQKQFKDINYREATLFATHFRNDYNANVSLSSGIGGAIQVKRLSKKTNPNVSVTGIDEDYLAIQGYKIDIGRNFSKNDLENSMNVVIVGQEVIKTLFTREDPINQVINFMGSQFKIIGVLEKKGSLGGGTGADRIIFVPLETGRALAANRALTFDITASAPQADDSDYIMEEARGLMRRIRNDALGRQDSFEIERADALAKNFEEISSYLRIGGFGIGIITLLGASIALMNIMMVSVTERTREIGIRKSLGATPRVIRLQFLIEAIVICILGGLAGLVLGIAIGNVISKSISSDSSFIVPWLWMFMGILVCVFVGVISGIYPAIKASRLDPIEALRYE
ncbi:ABC transporter permease [Arundinibacter roseus]|uniref:FtsX-like permease family protein n=1 Tax=Arundinibacter roseus TaxID=2070510 RepID=A0A4R4KD81_9BACT|nr:ABC transporter permease [Arundinibacter roseus]TDB64461.1 FtsX-like permease family protein [Arundinibacter roseus]